MDSFAGSGRLEEGADSQVDAKVRGSFAADGEAFPFPVREMKEAADVVIVVEGSEQGLGFLVGETESNESDRFAGLLRKLVVALNKFAKGHHRNAGRRHHSCPLRRECSAGGREREVRKLAGQAGIG